MMGDQATSGALADCTKNLGLNRPLVVQYVDYLWRSVRFDFGNSFRQGYPVSDYIARMFPHTFILVMASAIVAALVGIPIGIISALKRRNPLDRLSAADHRAPGALHARLLARDPAPDRVLAPPRSLPAHRRRRPGRRPRHDRLRRDVHPARGTSWRRWRRAPSPDLAGPRARIHAGSHGEPAVALGHAGGDQPGLHPHRPRQGPGASAWSSTSTRSAT